MEPDPRGSMGLGGTSGGANLSWGTNLVAIDYKTGKITWRKELNGGSAGLLTTAGGVLFLSNGQNVEAWDAATGKGLWYSQIGGSQRAADDVHARRQAAHAVQRRRRAVSVRAELERFRHWWPVSGGLAQTAQPFCLASSLQLGCPVLDQGERRGCLSRPDHEHETACHQPKRRTGIPFPTTACVENRSSVFVHAKGVFAGGHVRRIHGVVVAAEIKNLPTAPPRQHAPLLKTPSICLSRTETG